MAGPLSHIIYAEKVLRDLLPDKDGKLFIIGTLFPDIRALKVIDRDATHIVNVMFDDVRREQDSFRAGMLFHSLIDTTREALVRQHNAYANLPDSYLSTVALKMCEDMRLYPKSTSWPLYISYLQTIAPQEKQFNIPVEKLEKWHVMHQVFFADSSPFDNVEFFLSLGFTQEQIAELFELVKKIRKDHVTDIYLDDFYENLEGYLS